MKILLHFLFVIAILTLSSFIVYGQNCIDYGVFDDPACGNCAPSGWSTVNFGPEMENPSNGCTGQGASPSGGTYAALESNTGHDEAIETTVNGLTPGITYVILFWYMSETCGGNTICCGSLEITVDGSLFVFPPEDTWALAEICIEATSTSMDIELASALGGANQSWLFIDNADCSEANQACCSLEVELQEEDEVCPNEILQFEGEIINSTDQVVIEWTSNPIEGLDFLSDLSIIDPVFYYPDSDPLLESLVFTFEVTATDGNCEDSKEIEVTVSPNVFVEFDFEDKYCETFGEIDLPTVSDDGYTGTWQLPSINTNDWPNQTVNNLFTPDPNQDGCPYETDFEFQIEPYQVAEFDFPLEWCRSEFTNFEFPTTSLNGIDGEWNLSELDPEEHNDGLIELEFTPFDIFCSEIVIFDIELYTGDRLNFDLPSTYCADEGVIELPDDDNNNVNGIWTVNPLDLSQMSGPQVITFIPMDEDCHEPFTYSFNVTNSLSLSFDTIGPICRGSGVVTLDSFTLEGYVGFWSQPTFDPDTVNNLTFTSTWYPLAGQGACIQDTTLSFTIIEPIIPEFELPNSLCVSDSVFVFPLSSEDQSVNGTWSIPSVDPSVSGVSTVQSTFIPGDSLCALSFNWEIEITDVIQPEFSYSTTLCESDVALQLNNISDNGIQGEWSISSIDPNGLGGQTIQTTFSPATNNFCSAPLTMVFEIESETLPQFDIPMYLCWTDLDLVLDNTSDNGISGEWNSNTIVIEDNLGTIFFLEFTPDQELCASDFSRQVQLVDTYNVISTNTNPSSCSEANGSIELTGNLNNLEYSIDGGATWQTDNYFNNLEGGAYIIQVRSVLYPDCILEIDIELEGPGAPQILTVETENVTACNADDGRIIIEAQGNSLEYSIDNGGTWTSNNIFSSLESGTYTVLVRESGTDDCESLRIVMINDFPITEIVSASTIDPSDCDSENGEIEILAEGQNIEYSVDDGVNWSDIGTFTNLSDGVYEVIVRSKDDLDCLESLSVELLAPMMPIISDLNIVNPGNCNPDVGSITVEATGNELEYSIDNGKTWQVSNVFSGLIEGIYEIIVREVLQQNCSDMATFILVEENETLDDVEFEILMPASCNANDGQLLISSSNPNIEISFDQGVTWQSDLSFDNLAPGLYMLTVRHILYKNCQIEFEVIIDELECPCLDLDIDYSVTPVYCVDDDNGSVEIINVSGSMSNDYEVVWDVGENGLIIDNLSGGWFAFTVFYDEMCMWRDSVFIDEIDPLNFGLTTFDSNCPGAADGSIEVTEISGGNGNYTYSINGIDYQLSNVFVNLEPSEYQVFVLDEQNCLQSQFVELLSEEAIEIDFPQILSIHQGETVFLNPLINEMSIDSFSWTPSETIINPGNLVAEVAPQETTSYTLSIFYGLCIEVRIITVEVIEETEIYIANVFSPGSQDGNSTFYVQSNYAADIAVNNLSIYDRWGNLIFTQDNLEPNNPEDGWDGYYNNFRVQNGVYVYLIEYVLNGEESVKAGGVTVIY